jgi:hypothetical protein
MNTAPTKDQTEEIQEALLEMLGEEGIVYAQAVSICSLFTEMNVLRAEIDDIVDGLHQRFQGVVNKDQLKDTVKTVLPIGILGGLFEAYDDQSVTLTAAGAYVGQDWYNKLVKNEF